MSYVLSEILFVSGFEEYEPLDFPELRDQEGSWNRAGNGSTLDQDWQRLTIDVLFPLVGWLIEGFVYPFNNR